MFVDCQHLALGAQTLPPRLEASCRSALPCRRCRPRPAAGRHVDCVACQADRAPVRLPVTDSGLQL